MLKSFGFLSFCFLLLTFKGQADSVTAISITGPSSVTVCQDFSIYIDVANAPAAPGLAAYLLTVGYDAADLTQPTKWKAAS